jgi:hypothetical protein
VVKKETPSMKRDSEFFGDRELVLVYMARRLKEALALEEALNQSGFDYAVETGEYQGGLLFPSMRAGAFFYVAPEMEAQTRRFLIENGYKDYKANEGNATENV